MRDNVHNCDIYVNIPSSRTHSASDILEDERQHQLITEEKKPDFMTYEKIL
jgi:hypothetical protein